MAIRIAEDKFFHPPGLNLERRLNSTSRHILLIQCLDIGDANPTQHVVIWWVFRVRGIEVQSDPVTFDNGKPLVVIGGYKAELSIKGQGLLHISNKRTRSHGTNRWLTCGRSCHRSSSC